MKRTFFLILFTALLVVVPGVSLAQEIQTTPDAPFLVSCAGPTADENLGLPACNWCTLVQMISNMVQYGIYLAVILSALIFAYAGALLLLNNGNEKQITKALSIFKYVLIGIVSTIAAWLIIDAIMTRLATGLGLGSEWNTIDGCYESGPSVYSTPHTQYYTGGYDDVIQVYYPGADYSGVIPSGDFTNPLAPDTIQTFIGVE